MKLKPVDAVEVTIVMDTFVDILMASSDGVQRWKFAYDWSDRDNLLAEHGFSVLNHPGSRRFPKRGAARWRPDSERPAP